MKSLKMSPKPFSVSHTKLSTFRRCLQKYHWMYVDKYYPPPGVGQARGSAGHSALAKWHVDYNSQTAMDAAWIVWESNGYGQGDDWQLLEDALNRYFPWSLKNDNFKLLSAEEKFEIEFDISEYGYENIEPFTFIGYIDGIVEEDGHKWLLENKFYKRMDKSSKEMDQQSTMYLLAAQLLGYDVRGVIYNMVRVADSKVAVTEPVVRQRVFRNASGLEKVQHEVQIQTADMQSYHMRGGMPYRNMTKDCSWDCPFYNPCLSMLDDGQDPTEILQSLVNIRRTNAE